MADGYVSGLVDHTGNIQSPRGGDPGFRVNHKSEGRWEIEFDPPFPARPAVVAIAWDEDQGFDWRTNAFLLDVHNDSATIGTINKNGNVQNFGFSFVASY